MKIKCRIIGLLCAVIDLLMLSLAILAAQFVQTMDSNFGGEAFVNYYEYLSKGVVAIFIIILIIASYIGIYLPLQADKRSLHKTPT